MGCMRQVAGSEDGLVGFAERLISLLERTSVVATYKYAVVIALMDLCMEATGKDAIPRSHVTTRQVAEKVIELYWPQTRTYPASNAPRVLRQNTGKQARILSDILAFRSTLPDQSMSLHRARLEAPVAYQRLVHRVEWTLILMPLPRVQKVRGGEEPILYHIQWDTDIERKKRDVTAYQRGEESPFDNRILLKPGVPEYLVRLNLLLRPLIFRNWAALVARVNRDLIEEATLEEFLFGKSRVSLGPVAPLLRDIQNGACFYCGKTFGRRLEVDHFIPWSRYPDNGIENLVAAHARCNRKKRDFLADTEHLARWTARNTPGSPGARALLSAARETRWESHAEQTFGVARSIYLNLLPGVKLWRLGDIFVPADRATLRRVLAET